MIQWRPLLFMGFLSAFFCFSKKPLFHILRFKNMLIKWIRVFNFLKSWNNLIRSFSSSKLIMSSSFRRKTINQLFTFYGNFDVHVLWTFCQRFDLIDSVYDICTFYLFNESNWKFVLYWFYRKSIVKYAR